MIIVSERHLAQIAQRYTRRVLQVVRLSPRQLQDRTIAAIVFDFDSADVIHDVDEFIEQWRTAASWPEYYGIVTKRHWIEELMVAHKLMAAGGRVIPDGEFPDAWGRIVQQSGLRQIDLAVERDVVEAATALGLKLSGQLTVMDALRQGYKALLPARRRGGRELDIAGQRRCRRSAASAGVEGHLGPKRQAPAVTSVTSLQ